MCNTKPACTLGWPEKNESAPIPVLACAHMRMGIGNYHTKFHDIWSSRQSAPACQRHWPTTTYGKNFKNFFFPEIKILLCKGPLLMRLNYSVLSYHLFLGMFISN